MLYEPICCLDNSTTRTIIGIHPDKFDIWWDEEKVLKIKRHQYHVFKLLKQNLENYCSHKKDIWMNTIIIKELMF